MAKILEGEKLIWTGRPTWRWSVSLMLKGIGVGVLVIIIGVLIDRVVDIPVQWFIYVGIAAVVVSIILGWVKRIDREYTVTDKRVIVRRGYLNRNERSASLDRIQNVNTGQGLYGRLLNFGDIEFDTAGSDTGDSDLALIGIQDPHKMRDMLDTEVLAQRRSQGGI